MATHADPHRTRPAPEIRRAHDMLVAALAHVESTAPDADEMLGMIRTGRSALDWTLGNDSGPFADLLAVLRAELEQSGARERNLAEEN